MSQIYTQPPITPFHETSPYVFDKLRPDQYAPRDVEKYNTFAYSHPDRRYESSGWKSRPISPMSDQKRGGHYDVPAARVGEDYQTRPEISPRPPPREQLPPLSSLFSTSRPGGPAPYDKSPTFPAAQDSHRGSIPSHSDQSSWDSAHLRRHPSQSSYHSHDGRPPHSTQSELPPPPPRPMQINRPPDSPRFYDPRYSPQDSASLPQLPPSRNGWSPRSEPPYREYFPPVPRDSSSSLRSHLDQQPLQPSIHRRESDARQTYRDAPLAAVAASQYPSTPSSTVTSDTTASKDGLGPKIWTGTQFLPRFVRQAEVPGEGLCYFYDDGTHCKTHIDGEAVNAHWGVTKAGKPRKRLAIACITCREKKIKCDPDYPRCIQCEKFGRVCKFKNAPRGGQGSPETPPADGDELLTRPASRRSDDEISYRIDKRDGTHGASSQAGNHPVSEEIENAVKRRRYNDFTPANIESETGFPNRDDPTPTDRKTSILMNRMSPEHLAAQWNTNPYDTDEELVVALIDIFFLHVSTVTYDMFPEVPFISWLTNRCIEKSEDDLMLIYTMLAVATIFSSSPKHKKRGQDFAAISRYACDNRHFSIQLVQSRLLLSMYYFANNNPNDAWDFCGAAIRAATGMKLNQEIEKSDDDEKDMFPFNLNRHGFAECRRRTFWSAYLMDRFNGFCSGHLSILHSDDIFLRLPCDVKSFNEQVEVDNPFFDANTNSIAATSATIGAMAYLINISSIWGDVMANIYRSSQRPTGYKAQKPSTFSTFHETTTARLTAWQTCLPSYLTYNPTNLKNASDKRMLGSFTTMHSLYHATQMKLNRYVPPTVLSARQLESSIRTAHSHSEDMLRILDDIRYRVNEDGSRTFSAHDLTTLSSAFVGYATLSAVDIVSAKGSITSIPSLSTKFDGAVAVLAYLAEYFQSARTQKEMVTARIVDLCRVEDGWRDAAVVRVEDGQSARWLMVEPIEKTFAKGSDCVYASGMEVWERATGG